MHPKLLPLLTSLNSLDETLTMLNPTLQQKMAGKITSHMDLTGFTPIPDCEPQEAICPAQVTLHFPGLSNPQSPEAVSHFPLSSQTPNILPLPAPFHQSLSNFSTFHPLPEMDCPGCHPQTVPPYLFKCPVPTTLLSLCYIISSHSFILLDLLQRYIKMLLPLPAEKNQQKHPSLFGLFCFVLFFGVFILATQHGMRDLSSPTGDQTHTHCSGSEES